MSKWHSFFVLFVVGLALAADSRDVSLTYERAYASLLPGDFNADGTVNFIDFFMFSDVFNQPVTAANRKYDLAQDGAIIDFLDFFVFADNFNRTLAFAAHIQAVGFAEVNPAISGMAPFTVHVNALTSTFSAGNETASDISWDFGDSSESSDYNEIQGFNASHTYNEPGSYTLLLTIVTPESETVQRSVSVTIEEDTRSRIYLSSSGDDANTGMSKADPVRTLPRAAELATDNCWILFKRGEVFEDTDATLALIGLENVRVSTYGEGARPILTGGLESNEANPSHISFHQVTDLIIEDLEFTGPTDPAYLSADWYKGVSATDSESVNVTIRNNHFDNVGFSIVIVPTPGTESGSAGLLVQDNTTDLVGRYLIYSDLQNATIVGNEVLGTVEGHPIRIYGGPYNISFNQFDTDKERLAFEEQQEHAVGFSVNLVTGSHFYIGYNKIFAGNMIGYLTQFGISSVQNVVFEGNEFARCCHTWITTLRIFPACDNIVIKNNVFAGNQDAIRLEEAGAGVEGFSNRVRNVDVLFNTVYNPTPDGRFIEIYTEPEAGSVFRLIGNLHLQPLYRAAYIDNWDPYVVTSDVPLGQWIDIENNLWQTPLGGELFRIAGNPSTLSEWSADSSYPDGLHTFDLEDFADYGNSASPAVAIDPRPFGVMRDYSGNFRASQSKIGACDACDELFNTSGTER